MHFDLRSNSLTLIMGRRIASAISPLFVAVLLPTVVLAGAGDLMVYPTRLVFEGSKRSDVISLTNNGKDTATYEIGMIHYLMNAEGNLQQDTSSDTVSWFADKYLRFFPRQVTLAAGETQSVRVQVRGISDAPDGEYRAHLVFRAVPKPSTILGDAKDSGTVAVRINIVYGVSIPVVVRKGKLEAAASITDLNLIRDTTGAWAPSALAMVLRRTGTQSLYGSLSVSFAPDGGGAPVTLAMMRGLAVYVTSDFRHMSLAMRWPPELHPSSGRLTVEFRSGNEQNDPVIAKASIEVPGPDGLLGH